MRLKYDISTDPDYFSNSFTGTLVNATSSNPDWGRVLIDTVPIRSMHPKCVISENIFANTYYSTNRGMKLEIKKVIFNPPATIIFWRDKTKTVVKCEENDVFDPEKGIALCIAKKALGNKGNYYNDIKKWLPKDSQK